MPQLMPLFWILSNMFIILFLYLIMLVYGFSNFSINKVKFFKNGCMYSWCW